MICRWYEYVCGIFRIILCNLYTVFMYINAWERVCSQFIISMMCSSIWTNQLLSYERGRGFWATLAYGDYVCYQNMAAASTSFFTDCLEYLTPTSTLYCHSFVVYFVSPRCWLAAYLMPPLLLAALTAVEPLLGIEYIRPSSRLTASHLQASESRIKNASVWTSPPLPAAANHCMVLNSDLLLVQPLLQNTANHFAALLTTTVKFSLPLQQTRHFITLCDGIS